MGLLSSLLGIGGAIAAPFTGGGSLALSALGGLGRVAGQAAAGSSAQRQDENQQQLTRDQLLNQQYNTQQGAQMQAGNLDLQRKQYTDSSRGNNAKQALIASLLQNYSPTAVSVPGIKNADVGGGLGNAMLNNPNAQASLAQLYKDALAAQMNPQQFSGGQMLTPPTIAEPKGSSGLEKVLGGVGLGGSLLGALSGLGSGQSQMPSMPAPAAGMGNQVPGSPVDEQTLASLLARQGLMNGGQ